MLKLKLARSLIFSILFYNAQIWTFSDNSELSAVNRAYFLILARVAGVKLSKEEHLSLGAILRLLHQPTVFDIIRRKRFSW